MPAGQVIYDSLKSSFVDFPRLITTLEKEAYTVRGTQTRATSIDEPQRWSAAGSTGQFDWH